MDEDSGLLLWKEGGLGSFANSHTHVAFTSDGGASWQSYTTGTQPSRNQGPPAVAPAGNRRFHIVSSFPVLFGLHQLRIETADLSSGALVWTRNRLLPGGHSAIVYPDIACDRGTGVVHVTYTHYDDIESGLASPCRVYHVRSPDGGDTWSAPVILSGEGCDRSRIALGPDGEVYVSWVDASSEVVRMRRSDDGGLTFGPERVVAPFLDNRNTGMYGWRPPDLRPHPVYGDDMAVPDVPRLVVDHSSGASRGRVYMAWTDHATGVPGPHTGDRGESPPNDTYETATVVPVGTDMYGSSPSADLGGSADVWAFDGVAGQSVWITGNVDYIPDPPYVETKLQVVYCRDGTGQVNELARTNTVHQPNDGSPPVLAMRPMILTLPSTGRYYIIVGGAGPYTLDYRISLREWQVAAGSAARDQRDVVLLSSGDRGVTWGEKVRVGDAPHRYDESHPEVVVDAAGRVHVTWLDRRAEPVCGSLTDQYWAFSLDGGRSFSPGHRLSSRSTTTRALNPPTTISQFHGERNALAANGEWVHAFWTDRRSPPTGPPDKGADIWGTRMQVGDLVSTAVARFGVEPLATGVRVTWRIHDGRGLLGVRVERSAATAETFTAIDAQAPDGALEGEHAVVDDRAEPGRTYRYRLALEQRDGRVVHEGPVSVTLPEGSVALAMDTPTPNPTASRTRLALSMPRAGHAAVDVYDVGGKRVGRVHEGPLAEGRHVWQWPERDVTAAPGIYLVRAVALGESRATRVIVTR